MYTYTSIAVLALTVCQLSPISAREMSVYHNDGLLMDPVQIECNSNNIMVTLNSDNFNGMIYPKGLSKNSSCMIEYTHGNNVTYILPLRACNTMSADVVSDFFFLLFLLSEC